jgi:hypothetical protein
VKRIGNVASVLAITWGTCFLMTMPFGIGDLWFSLVFATVLAAAMIVVAGVGILAKRGWEAFKRR